MDKKKNQIIAISVISAVFAAVLILAVVMSVLFVKSDTGFKRGWDTNAESSRLGVADMTSAIPSAEQRRYAEDAYFGLFSAGEAKTPDTVQWAEAAAAAGFAGVLAEFRFTEGTRVDYELLHGFHAACRGRGIRFGISFNLNYIYERVSGDAEKYVAELAAELCRLYDGIFEIRFDLGAQLADAGMFASAVKEIQPGCLISVKGGIGDIRSVDYGAGSGDDYTWSVIQSNGAYVWAQTEICANIADGNKLKSTSKLKEIYLDTVGKNCTLLLNVTVSDNGKVAAAAVGRLDDFRKVREDMLERHVYTAARVGGAEIENKRFGFSEGFLFFGQSSRVLGTGEFVIDFKFVETKPPISLETGKKVDVKYIVFSENVLNSQRIESVEIYAKTSGNYVKVRELTSIGGLTIVALSGLDAPLCDGYRVLIKQSRGTPDLSFVGFYS